MALRDQLIADWQQRLDVASEPQSGASKRSEWLNRVRRRLYRFLLSLYGDGSWNAPPPSCEPENAGRSAVFDAPDVLPLSGKPAKTGGVIRTVLKAVAQAQDSAVQSGPLAGGLPADSWVIAAAASAHLRVSRVVRLLKHHGIAARLSCVGHDRLVEVKAKDRHRALALISASEPQLRGREREGPLAGIHFLTGFTLVTVLAPFIVAPVLAVAMLLIDGNTATAMFQTGPLVGLFLAGWGACIVLYFAIAAIGRFSAWLRQIRDG